jgi:hydroxyacylglutathione hydrolase
MPYEVKIIPDRIANCYLVKTGEGFIMVDTGVSFFRGNLKNELEKAGCKPGNLKLIIITHVDFDHTGNCAYLRKKYGAKIAIHREESGAAQSGRMFLSRKSKRGIISEAMIYLAGLVIFRRFKPDMYLNDGDDLSGYGWDAKVLHTPGHTTGSISILTREGDFFCGDLMVNGEKPSISRYSDNFTEVKISAGKLKNLNIKTVYPGHGKPFLLDDFFKNNP